MQAHANGTNFSETINRCIGKKSYRLSTGRLVPITTNENCLNE